MIQFVGCHHKLCLFVAIIILILLHDWSTYIVTAYVAPPSKNLLLLLSSRSISRSHANNKCNQISCILHSNNNNNDYCYQEDTYKAGKGDNNDNYDTTNTANSRSATCDSVIVSDEIAFRACYVYLQRHKRLGPWHNEIERKKKQLIEKEEYIESLQQSRRTFQEQKQRHKLGKQQHECHEEKDLEKLRSKNAIDNNMYDSNNSNDNTIVLHSRIGRQNLVQQDIALSSLLREDDEEDSIDGTEQYFYRNTNHSNKNLDSIGRIASVGTDNDNDDDYNDDDDDANEIKQMKKDLYWENYDTITTASSSSSEHSNEGSTHSTTRSSSSTFYGDYYYDSNNAKTSSSSYTTSSSSYYKIDDETPSKQHVKRSKAALQRWADPEWKQKWYEQRWGANSNSRSNMKQPKQRQQSSTLPFLYQPQSSRVNLNNVNNKKKDIDYYLELYKQSLDLQQQQEQQQQPSSTTSLSNNQLTSNDFEFVLPISTFNIDTAADGGYYSKQQQQKQNKNQIIVSKSINEIATNMNETEIDFAIQSYISSNQKRIVSRQRTIQQRKRLIRYQQKRLFQTPQSTTLQTIKATVPEQKQTENTIAIPNIFTSFYTSDNNNNENSAIMHNFLLQQKQKRSESATRAYEKRHTNINSKKDDESILTTIMASKVADSSMRFGQKNSNITSSSANNSTKASSAYQRMNLVTVSQILDHHQNSLQSAFTPMERLQRIEWFLDEYCKHKKNEKQKTQQQQQSEIEKKLWTFDDYCEHGYYVSTVGTGVISTFLVNDVLCLDRRHIISPSTANGSDSDTYTTAATSPILNTILPDYFMQDIEAILIPTKLSRRRHVLRRILDILFNLRGRCIPPMSTTSTTSATTKIKTAPSLSSTGSLVDTTTLFPSTMSRTSSDTLLFATQCSIFDLGSFVLFTVRDRSNQQQSYQQQTTAMYTERNKFIVSKSPL